MLRIDKLRWRNPILLTLKIEKMNNMQDDS